MGNLGLYVETARKRSRELRERFIGREQGADVKELIAGLTKAERELFEERAGIMELDGELSREETELEALKESYGGK